MKEMPSYSLFTPGRFECASAEIEALDKQSRRATQNVCSTLLSTCNLFLPGKNLQRVLSSLQRELVLISVVLPSWNAFMSAPEHFA